MTYKTDGTRHRAAEGRAVIPAGGWVPHYEPWRHGGWYVTNICYPSGAVGCVSRNYTDKKWRVVGLNTGPGVEGDQTYPLRDTAALAELSHAAEAAYKDGVFDTSRLWLGRRTPQTAAQRESALAGIARADADWEAGELTTSDDMIRAGWDEYKRTGYELRYTHELVTVLAMYDPDAGLTLFRTMNQREIRRRQVIAREQVARSVQAGNDKRAGELRLMEAALAQALQEKRP